MHLRTKITAAFAVLFAAFLAADYTIERRVTYQNFELIEAQTARRNLDRWVQATEREIAHLSEFAGDWTDWDDAFEFASTGDPAFVEANLSSDNWFESYNIPVLLFVDREGRTIWERVRAAETGAPVQLARLRAALAEGSRPLLADDNRPMIRGILPTSEGLLLVVSRAIFRTDGSGPAAGFAIFGRFFDDELARTIGRQTLARGAVQKMGEVDPADATLLPAIRRAAHEPVLRRHGGMLAAYTTMDDVFGEPSIVVRSDTPTVVTAQGRLALWISVITLGATGLAALLAQIALIQRLVVRPLAGLVEHATNVGATGDLSKRLSRTGRDEIGEMARAFDRMVVSLAESRAALVARSRATGQAEIASSVAHNLGNVLNSAAVSVDAIQRRLASVRVEGPARVAGLLRDHGPDLPEYLASEGRQLPDYLDAVSAQFEADRAALLEESVRVQEQIRHMDEILGAQRRIAKRGSYTESTSARDIVERALAIVQPSCRRHGIQIESALESLPPLQTDPVQVGQILVNLLTNAKDAVLAAGRERRLRVAVRREDDAVRIEVADSGCGFDPDATEELFRAGFTSKPHGEGLGLHYCALSARQLGGSLEARSDGPGAGAVFTLTLPLRPGPWKEAA
ncbi:MAG: HAMP domain-containing protein [Phycisphaerales bacterium]|nr:HAMP domain-containing protein [Phycisphaerales bacterium]